MALDFGIDVSIDLQDVRPAVIIVINEAATPSNVLVADADSRGECNVTEGSVAVVVEEDAGFGIHGDINIGPAVIIKIIGDGSDAIPRARLEDSGLRGDIGKGAVAVVVEEN